VAQGRLLTGRDPVAVTAVQFLGATLGALPVAVLTEGAPVMPTGAGAVLAVAALALGGTLAPFTLFAFGQSRVSAEVAGAFLNLEPLVGAVAGAVAFGDKVGLAQVAGGLAILAGIGLSSLPLITARRAEAKRVAAAPAVAAAPQPTQRPHDPRQPRGGSEYNDRDVMLRSSGRPQHHIAVVSRSGPAHGRAAGRPPGQGRKPGGRGGRREQRSGRAARRPPARGRLLLQVGGQEGQVGGRQAVAGGLGLVPVRVEQRRGTGRVELGSFVVAEGEVRGGQVVGELLVGAGADHQ
jgi:hypothetical protein